MALREAMEAVMRFVLRRQVDAQDQRIARSRQVAELMHAAGRRESTQTDKLRRSGRHGGSRLAHR